jgi:hypothetical protein
MQFSKCLVRSRIRDEFAEGRFNLLATENTSLARKLSISSKCLWSLPKGGLDEKHKMKKGIIHSLLYQTKGLELSATLRINANDH